MSNTPQKALPLQTAAMFLGGCGQPCKGCTTVCKTACEGSGSLGDMLEAGQRVDPIRSPLPAAFSLPTLLLQMNSERLTAGCLPHFTISPKRSMVRYYLAPNVPLGVLRSLRSARAPAAARELGPPDVKSMSNAIRCIDQRFPLKNSGI